MSIMSCHEINLSVIGNAYLINETTEFVQNPNTFSGNGQTNEIVKTICSLLMLIIQIEKDNDDGWCEVDECPSGVTYTITGTRCYRQ